MLKRLATIAIIAVLSGFAMAQGMVTEETGYRRNVGAHSLYLAIMPAEVLRGPLAPEAAGASLSRPAAERDTHHVMVSVFESHSGRRVEDALVQARVAALGMSGLKKVLDPTRLAGTVTYGNFFPMIGRGPYRVDVEFRMPAAARPQHASFYFTHPNFEAPQPDKRKERKP